MRGKLRLCSLNRKQKREVHNSLLEQELDVAFNQLFEFNDVASHEPNPVWVFVDEPNKVNIFQNVRALCLRCHLHVALDFAALDVEDFVNLLCVLELERVRHQHDIDVFAVAVHFYCVDSINPSNQRLLPLCQMNLVVRQHAEKHVHFLIGHRLYDKLSVSREEEERATCASPFPHFENHVAVVFRIQRLDEHFGRDSICLLDALEEEGCMDDHINVDVNAQIVR